MTKAKRYEGEKLRSEQWYGRGRSRAWERRDAGAPELARILNGKFNLYVEVTYNEETMCHDIKVEVGPGGPSGPMGRLPPVNIVLTHQEPSHVFPSEHLKTKLLLIAG